MGSFSVIVSAQGVSKSSAFNVMFSIEINILIGMLPPFTVLRNVLTDIAESQDYPHCKICHMRSMEILLVFVDKIINLIIESI